MMKIFISYARVDKPFCQQVAEILDIHQVWYDQRLYAGQHWWDEILRRLDWCDIFIYLLSPDAVESPYCQREFEIAIQSNKAILPVLIDEDTSLPASLTDIQYADMCNGFTNGTVKSLLNSIYLIERQHKAAASQAAQEAAPPQQALALAPPAVKEVNSHPTTLIGKVAEAMEIGKFDDAVFLLRQAQERGDRYDFINLDALLSQAELGLEEQAVVKGIEREYRAIAELVKRQQTRMIGCQAFAAFRGKYPDYDPDGLSTICSGTALSAQSFRPQTQQQQRPQQQAVAGQKPQNAAAQKAVAGTRPAQISGQPVRRVGAETAVQPVAKSQGVAQAATNGHNASHSSSNGHKPSQASSAKLSGVEATPRPARTGWNLPMLDWVEIPEGKGLDGFWIARYPTTNIQFDTFIKDPKGYMNPEWWSFSVQSKAWAEKNPRPRPGSFKGDKRPRESINWYEAMAFCAWLGVRLSRKVTLPTQAQWRRAAQGDTDYLYPWGNQFDKEYCNTRESRIRMTTSVQRYPHGASSYGVHDMPGNTWEWCLDTAPNQKDDPNSVVGAHRALLGGSFTTSYQNAQANYDFYLDPKYYYSTIGFRCAVLS